MPIEECAPNPDQAKVKLTRPSTAGRARTRSAAQAAQKGAATVRRHQKERRTADLEHMRAQIADGTLVIRQMTLAQHDIALQAARSARARGEARVRSNRALRIGEPWPADVTRLHTDASISALP
ncbi:MAG TPA: hypothetical protein VIJ20_10575 [Solirubrobacteraceae bacterium]